MSKHILTLPRSFIYRSVRELYGHDDEKILRFLELFLSVNASQIWDIPITRRQQDAARLSLKKAADGNDPLARYAMALLYEGKSRYYVPRNYSLAVQWYCKTAKLGGEYGLRAQHNLADLYSRSRKFKEELAEVCRLCAGLLTLPYENAAVRRMKVTLEGSTRVVFVKGGSKVTFRDGSWLRVNVIAKPRNVRSCYPLFDARTTTLRYNDRLLALTGHMPEGAPVVLRASRPVYAATRKRERRLYL